MPPKTENAFDAAFDKMWKIYSARICRSKASQAMKKGVCKLFFLHGAHYVCDRTEDIRKEIFDAT